MISLLHQRLLDAVEGDETLLAFPDKPFFNRKEGRRKNLEVPVVPAAVTCPRTTEQVANIVRCASEFCLHVQARSGGHSYGNYGLGGRDGAIVVDLKNFQHFYLDRTTWRASFGAGHRLREVARKLYATGKRAMAHGTCPSVGAGGHLTIGGIGPTSRMWGTALDHIEEVTVVLADSTVTKASKTKNSDLFFALRGAGAGFGIITEFTVRTRPAPEEAVLFSFNLPSSQAVSMANTFKEWQHVISKPDLSRRLFTQVELNARGMTISGTFFGPLEDFHNQELAQQFFAPQSSGRRDKIRRRRISVRRFTDWEAMLQHWAGGPIISALLDQPCHFYHKSLSITPDDLLPSDTVDELFVFVSKAKKGTPFWFVILDIAGGAINDVPLNETAFACRSVLYYVQSYAVSLGAVSNTTKDFLRGVNDVVQRGLVNPEPGIYPGYIDPELADGQRRYWGPNLERLQIIKTQVDPLDVFHNPQSVRPAIVSPDLGIVRCLPIKEVARHAGEWSRVYVKHVEVGDD